MNIYVVRITDSNGTPYRSGDTVFSTASDSESGAKRKFLEETKGFDRLPEYTVVRFIEVATWLRIFFR